MTSERDAVIFFDDIQRAWRTNNEVNLRVLALCPDEAMDLKPGKGKTIRSNYVHILGVRRMRLEEHLRAEAQTLAKLDWKTATREEIITELHRSSALMERLWAHFEARTRPHRWSTALLLSYCIAHEAHHRSQVEIALRLGGHEPDEMDLYALWDWTKLAPSDPTD